MRANGWLMLAVTGCFATFGIAASGQAPRWVESNSWKGSGVRQTETFFLNGDRSVLEHKHSGNGLFQISLYDDKGKLLDVPINLSNPISGIAFLTDRGARYLQISAAAGDWQVTLKQYLTKAEEWNLTQVAQSYPPPARKQAVWTGESGDASFDFTIPKGPWKLVGTAENDGILHLQVKDSSGLLECDLSNNREAGSLESWGHQAGTFTLSVKAKNTAWKVELFGE